MNESEKQKLEFEDWQNYITKELSNNTKELGRKIWLTLYEYTYNPYERRDIYSVLIPPEMRSEVIDDIYSDLLIGNGMPNFDYSTNEIKYLRYGNNEGIEPLIFYRDFYGIKEPYLEISEEFRHFFNLYHDKKTGNYIFIDDEGNEVDVVKVEENRTENKYKVQVELSFIKKFLAVKNMLLVICFEIDRYSNSSLEELDIREGEKLYKDSDYIYSIFTTKWKGFFDDDNRKICSKILGKKLIKGLENYNPDLIIKKKKEFADFIIKLDENGEEVRYTCDKRKLSNNFGANQGAPHYLTPIFFKKEVLKKYYDNPSKYSVEDGYLRCGSLWGMKIDNDDERYVRVFLGDLGTLPYKEQIYWKSFNVPPEGTISTTAFKRNIMAEFTKPGSMDLCFIQKYNDFQDKWRKKFGWYLFKPLLEVDKYHLDSLHIPHTFEQKEFDEQVLSLSIILIDSLNEKKLEEGLTLEEGTKGIGKLKSFLEKHNCDNLTIQRIIGFFRELQDLRSSSSAHRKGENYSKFGKDLGFEKKGLKKVFIEFLEKAIEVLNLLEEQFINDKV